MEVRLLPSKPTSETKKKDEYISSLYIEDIINLKKQPRGEERERKKGRRR